jgi:outer membrane protein
MRYSLLPVLALCAASVATAPLASAQAAGSKVGVINLQRALLETADLKKASAELESKYKPRQEALAKVEQELNDIQVQLQSTQGKLSPTAEAELNSRGRRKQNERDRLTEDLQADVERERSDILQRAGTRMNEIIKKLADEKGLDMVVDSTTTLYFRPAIELTEDAIKAYDKAYPVK